MKIKYLFFYIPFFLLTTVSLVYFNYNKINDSFDTNCKQKPINYVINNNLSNYKIISQDLDVYPATKNLFCLGKVTDFYIEDEGTTILIYGTNQNVKSLVYFFTSLIFFIFILYKVEFLIFIELLFIFIFFHYLFF